MPNTQKPQVDTDALPYKPDETTPEYAAFWDAVDNYATSCGGTIDGTRARAMAAAVLYERLCLLLAKSPKRPDDSDT